MSQATNGTAEGPKLETTEKPPSETCKVTEASTKLENLEDELHNKTVECESLKTQNARLELDLIEANSKIAQNGGGLEFAEVHKLKDQSEDMLTRAKAIIFEKTKMCKNQELQIEALNAQVTSLKDVVAITKNLLEIRNIEVKHLQDQVQCLNDKMACEKQRQDLVHQKLEKMIRMNGDLKREYETQLCLFTALRERYSERELARNVLEAQSQSQSTVGNTTSTPSTESSDEHSKTD